MTVYGAILADPPWHWRARSPKGDGRAPPYSRMSVAEIAALPIGELAAPDCALFLWAIDPLLSEALEVIAAWGFAYKTVAFTWIKSGKNGVFPIAADIGLAPIPRCVCSQHAAGRSDLPATFPN